MRREEEGGVVVVVLGVRGTECSVYNLFMLCMEFQGLFFMLKRCALIHKNER